MEEASNEMVSTASSRTPLKVRSRGKTLKKMVSSAATTNSVTWKDTVEATDAKQVQPTLPPPPQIAAPNAVGIESLVSPEMTNGKSFKEAAASTARRISPRLKNFVITPQEHDVGMTLMSMASPKPLKSSRHRLPPSEGGVELRSRTSPKVVVKNRKSRKTKSRRKASNKFAYQLTFPEIVHNMVSYAARNCPSVMDWHHGGEAFVIDDKHADLPGVIKKFFRHGKYSSLQRQLNMYGWSKHLIGAYEGCFHNPGFHRDAPKEEIGHIQRKGPPGRAQATKSVKRVVRRQTRVPPARKVATTKKGTSSSGEGEWMPTLRLPVKKENAIPARAAKKVASKFEKPSVPKIEKPESLLPLKKRTPTRATVSGSRYMKRTPPPKSTPMRYVGGAATPREAHFGLYTFDHGMSPVAFSPFFPGLHRQTTAEVFGNVPLHRQTTAELFGNAPLHRQTTAELFGNVPSDADQRRNPAPRHPGANIIPGTNETKAYATHTGFQWPRPYNASDRVEVIPRSATYMSGTSDFLGWAASPMQVRSSVARTEPATTAPPDQHSDSPFPSPSGVCPSPKATQPNPSNVAPLPVLSREPSAALIPVPLVQRVSSSFFLPFFGVAETLRSPMQGLWSPSTPKKSDRAS